MNLLVRLTREALQELPPLLRFLNLVETDIKANQLQWMFTDRPHLEILIKVSSFDHS